MIAGDASAAAIGAAVDDRPHARQATTTTSITDEAAEHAAVAEGGLA